ncbi:N-6 DNA methylase [Aquabacterium sp.]|uniref:N-6 DNA methylase n=1 Tax=Aquabacterium TaxID=92793 RepID=UPI001D32B7B5|nr:N-6 DNA methylase [Aquabacterium sp.]MBT9608987.1 N-6 DNA methylase [Aquabacterium sp.]|tara:strand:- start:400 stop:1473 length:1074 start_codon:yes stop_codon:yes gene_type:complete
MGLELDKYYTPSSVAYEAFERVTLDRAPLVCGDTACGSGQLLEAARDVLQAKHFLGIDKDRSAIHKLRKAQPAWKLYTGDLLLRKKPPSLDFQGVGSSLDLLVLNPPFSLRGKKYVEADYFGHSVRCSVAMAHILHSAHLFKPKQGIVAVVPESLLHSETDSAARSLLARNYSISELLRLDIYTFKGARVNSSIVQLSGEIIQNSHHTTPLMAPSIEAKIVRGGLQMHCASVGMSVPLVHSTSLRALTQSGLRAALPRTDAIAKGRIKGWVILLPRVGVPGSLLCKAIYLKTEVQLSDCVLAICFARKDYAVAAERRINSAWVELLDIYKGTAAKYVTIARLANYLEQLGFESIEAE